MNRGGAIGGRELHQAVAWSGDRPQLCANLARMPLVPDRRPRVPSKYRHSSGESPRIANVPVNFAVVRWNFPATIESGAGTDRRRSCQQPSSFRRGSGWICSQNLTIKAAAAENRNSAENLARLGGLNRAIDAGGWPF
jgi:hypothetical protein